LSNGRVSDVLVVNRFRVPLAEGDSFRPELEAALAVLARQRGYADGQLGRNVDDPELWTYDVKLGAVALLGRALDEPSAYESLDGELNVPGARELG
jgi:hypothetical protein